MLDDVLRMSAIDTFRRVEHGGTIAEDSKGGCVYTLPSLWAQFDAERQQERRDVLAGATTGDSWISSG